MARRKKANGGDGAEASNVLEGGGNIAPLQADIVQARDAVLKLKAANRTNNEEMREIKADLKEKGLTIRAFNRALKDYETSEQEEDGALKLKAEDVAYWIAREAMGLSSQPDLFEGAAGQVSDTSDATATA